MAQTDYREHHQMALPPGFQFDEYRLEDVLGKGGFGITYLASDAHLGTKVAIKELLPDGIATRVQTTTVVPQTNNQKDNFEWAQQRFIDEARALAKLNHPNIVRVLRLFRANGTAYMVMEYIEGKSLEDWMKQQGGSPPEKDLRHYVAGVLDGLEYIHKLNLYHRDIKPDNIFLRPNGEPVLIDFGSARADLGKTMMMTSVVTHGYSPFEQYQTASRQGPYTDFYSLAAVLFRAVTGKKPPSAIDRISDDSALRPMLDQVKGSYSENLLSAIERGMSLKVEQRPQTAADFRQLLADGAAHVAAPAAPASSPAKEAAPPPPLPPTPAPPTPAADAPAVAGIASGKLMVIHGLLGFVMTALWMISFFHPALPAGATLVPNLLDTVTAFILPFCAVWPLVALIGRKMGAPNLYRLSAAAAAAGTLLLSAGAASVVFLSNPTYQEIGAKAFRFLLLPEWIFVWSVWISRLGLAGDREQKVGHAWSCLLLAVLGSLAASLILLPMRSAGSHADVFVALGLSFAACALAVVLGLGGPKELQRHQVVSLGALSAQDVSVWGIAVMSLLMILVGHQTADLAALAAPESSFKLVAVTWLPRLAGWLVGMGLLVTMVSRRNVQMCLTAVAGASIVVALLPTFLGYSGDGSDRSQFMGWIAPLVEGVLQGAFLAGMALLATEIPPRFRVAAGMLSFIVALALGAVLSAALAMFLDPRLPQLGFVPRSPFGDHPEVGHAATWTTLAVTQALLAAMLAGLVQIAVPAALKNKK